MWGISTVFVSSSRDSIMIVNFSELPSQKLKLRETRERWLYYGRARVMEGTLRAKRTQCLTTLAVLSRSG